MNTHALALLEFEKVRRMLVRWTFSPSGRRRAELLGPDLSLEEIRLSQTRISEWRTLELRNDAPGAVEMPDVEPLLHRLSRGAELLEGDELVAFAPLLSLAVRLRRLLPRGGAESALGKELTSIIGRVADLSALDARWTRSLSPSGELLDTASSELARARRSWIESQQRASELLNRLLDRAPDERGEAFVTLRDGRYVVSIRTQQRALFPGILHGRSQTGQSLHLEPLEALDANNLVAESSEDVRREEIRLRRELTSLLRDSAPALMETIDAITTLDLVRAGARLALELGAEPPSLNERGVLRIVSGRHPLLVEIERRGGAPVVPLEVEIEGARSVLVVSGPNMGGKTVALKTIGLLTLMARAGLFVPAAPGTDLPLVDDVFVDLGDEQSVESDLSTFAGHLRNIGEVWEKASARSLVLLDELGGGTDPEEGGAIAMALLAGLAQRGSLTLATTHLTSIKLFVETQPKMQNGSMEFDSVSLRPRFRLRMGEAGRSRAFEIARRLLPGSTLLQEAEQFRSRGLIELDRISQRLETEQRALEEERARLERERAALSDARARHERQSERLHARVDALRSARAERIGGLYDETRAALARLRSETETRVKEALAAGADLGAVRHGTLESVRRAEREVARGAETFAPETPRRERGRRLAAHELQPGSIVWSPDLRAAVRIVQVSLGSPRLWVEWDGRRVEVPTRSLEELPTEQAAARPNVSPRRASASSGSTGSSEPVDDGPTEREVDLRGMSALDALDRLERFLDRSAVRRVSSVRIVHGKGTGALKRAVEEFLKRHPLVGRSRQGEPSEGGWGVTVVELEESSR